MIHKILSKQDNAKDCFICGTENKSGLQANFYELDNKKIACVFNAKSIHEGHPGILHGGIICSILDETAGRAMAAVESDISAFTIELKTNYFSPVPSNTELTAVGWVEEIREKVYISVAEIYLPDGRTAARGRGVYYIVKNDTKKINAEYHKVFPSELDRFELDIPEPETSPDK